MLGTITNMHVITHLGWSKVNEAFVEYYASLLGSNHPTVNADLNVIAAGICLTEEQQLQLSLRITNLEIKDALFAIASDKSPGYHGFSSAFFKQSWKLIESDF